MPGLDELKKKITEKKEIKTKPEAVKGIPFESIDMDAVETIVSKMKKRYAEQGIEFEEVSGPLKELRGVIAGGEHAAVRVQTVEDLGAFQSPVVRQLGRFYLLLRAPLQPITRLVERLPMVRTLDYHLYSANMRYSAQQFLAVSVAVSFIGFLVGLGLGGLVTNIIKAPLAVTAIVSPLIGFIAFMFILGIALLVPKNKAQKRGDMVSVELPFALRHMATELRAGIGLYKTLQAIAVADYGVLSEEFARTINEIEEGTDAKDALRHFALRTQSKALRNALLHVIRALKTGGNLSEVMNDIAEDVSFEMRMKIRDFGEKMNLFGVMFVIGGIVAPVMIAILGAITNVPFGIPFGKIPPQIILIFFVVLMPMMLVFLIFYLKITQPRV